VDGVPPDFDEKNLWSVPDFRAAAHFLDNSLKVLAPAADMTAG
jgi:hypothetical protein